MIYSGAWWHLHLPLAFIWSISMFFTLFFTLCSIFAKMGICKFIASFVCKWMIKASRTNTVAFPSPMFQFMTSCLLLLVQPSTVYIHTSMQYAMVLHNDAVWYEWDYCLQLMFSMEIIRNKTKRKINNARLESMIMINPGDV